MYKENFDELWNKTVNSVLCGISSKNIKGNARINEYLRGFVWEYAWGNKKLVPPERKFLDDLSKENPKKAIELESIISTITVSNSWGFYVGLVAVFAGIVMLFVTHGAVQLIAGAVAIIGIGLAISDALKGSINPKKAASNALAKAKEKCDKVLL